MWWLRGAGFARVWRLSVRFARGLGVGPLQGGVMSRSVTEPLELGHDTHELGSPAGRYFLSHSQCYSLAMEKKSYR